MRAFGRTWTTVRLPERELGETILDVAAPMLAGLGTAPTAERTREALALVVLFWNASVRASKRWERRRAADLNKLKKELRGRTIDGSPMFDVLAERCKPHWLDPRLVEDWTYDEDAVGKRRLVCTVGLPDGVQAEVLPPTEKRIKIGGVFLDEVRIRMTATSDLGFPYSRHSGLIAEDGTATVEAMMPTVLQLFAEGRLHALKADSVEVDIGGRALGLMVLVEVRSAGQHHDVATLVFKPAPMVSGG